MATTSLALLKLFNLSPIEDATREDLWLVTLLWLEASFVQRNCVTESKVDQGITGRSGDEMMVVVRGVDDDGDDNGVGVTVVVVVVVVVEVRGVGRVGQVLSALHDWSRHKR
ncbi:hypothetical protein Pmani_025996 [Petrolisthes manimaculis]|uniref:Uncharacterized protein n=1 Tax=Petrolisthes manimaculis TaxID=1843537 RepID=A0AAE1P5K2_9EUCA|nr:hypothetical protein Pmani_025996 [Petrolisthes manimaculis]